MKRITIAFLTLLICGCDARASNQKMMNKLTYTKDHNTGLCFAAYALGSQYAMFTNVPCNPAVEAEIARNFNGTNSSHP